jgi:hypothetical protein
MRRRELILVLAGAMTAGRSLRAQQKAMPLIGFSAPSSPCSERHHREQSTVLTEKIRRFICRSPSGFL